jgi:hypothetical protein
MKKLKINKLSTVLMLMIKKNKLTTQLCKNLVLQKTIKKWEKLDHLIIVILLWSKSYLLS